MTFSPRTPRGHRPLPAAVLLGLSALVLAGCGAAPEESAEAQEQVDHIGAAPRRERDDDADRLGREGLSESIGACKEDRQEEREKAHGGTFQEEAFR